MMRLLRKNKPDQEELDDPEWEIVTIQSHMPIAYLLSGGFTLPGFVPGWSYNFFRSLENLLSPIHKHIGMFAYIVLKKTL